MSKLKRVSFSKLEPEMKLRFAFLALILTTCPAIAQFTIRDVVISDTSSNLVDPEIDWLGNRIVWADWDGVWIADIDPVTGDFIPENGKGVLVDSTPSFPGMSAVANGPEWAMSRDGSEAIYPDSTTEGIHVRIGRVRFENGRWVQRPLENSTNRIPFFASYDGNSLHGGITSASVNPLTMKGEGMRLRFAHDTAEVLLPADYRGGRWIKGFRGVSIDRKLGKVYEAGYFDIDAMKYEKVLETETEIDQVWVIPMPEYNNIPVLWCIEKKPAYDEFGFYAKINNTWRKVDSLRPPTDRNEIFSPEPFWWKDKSYLFLVARPRQGQPRSLYDQVWILGLDPRAPFSRMISEESPARRTDPEVYYTSTEPVIYYTETRVDNRKIVHRCATGLADAAPAYEKAPFDPMVFAKDYFPGMDDINGRHLGSTETMSIVQHKGKLFAGMGNWMDYPWQLATEGTQILRKDSHNSQWVVDTSLGYRSMRSDALLSVNFAKDHTGNTLPAPVNLLVCGAGDISIDRPREVNVWVRDDAKGQWLKNTALTVDRGSAGIRSFLIHTDKGTDRQWLFCGMVEGSIIKAAYDPTAQGFLRFDTTHELRDMGRVMAMCECNGDLYVAAGVDLINGADTVGGLYRRIDGESPTWELVYRWPYIPLQTGDEANIMRGLTCVPATDGSNGNVIIGTRANPGIVQTIDPGRMHEVKTELSIKDYCAAQWDVPFYRGVALSAYNYFTPDTLNGNDIWWQGLWVEHPDNDKHPYNGSHFLVRSKDGTYKYEDVFDDKNPVPAGERLRGCRTICRSPFPEEPQTWYFGGYDCAKDTSKNTAWIYKGSLKQGTTSVDSDHGSLPLHVALHQNYPNPFNASTVISYELAASGHVTLKVLDVLGREVATLVDGYQPAGIHHATFSLGLAGRVSELSLTSGVYLYQLRSGSASQTRKMVLK